MELSKLIEICKQNEYPDEFSYDLVCMYPLMIKKYGQGKIDKLLTEWKYSFINKVGASGSCDRSKKVINVNLYGWKLPHIHLYRVVTATIHEVEHALGTLCIDNNTFLDDGKENNDDFFTKMEEAIASDYQDDLLVGELEYNYSSSYNFKCRGDFEHYDTSYPIEKFYLNVFKIILGNDAKLIEEMMHEPNINNKKNIFDNITRILDCKLNDSQFGELINSCALLIYNHGYSSLYNLSSFEERKETRRKNLYKLNYEIVENGELSLEEYNKEFSSWFEELFSSRYGKVLEIVEKKNISNIGIVEQCDKLSEVTVDYLIDNLNRMQYFDFELVKSACVYFTKINNTNPSLKEKNCILDELLKKQLSSLDVSFSDTITSKFDESEVQTILIKLISLKEMSVEKLNDLEIVIPESQTNFMYFTDGNSIMKLGRYSDFEKDSFKDKHDLSLQGIYLDKVIPGIKLSGDLKFGDEIINNNINLSGQKLLNILEKQKGINK
ncbi:hypothetical protein EGP98_01000 [bacterium]|nr:hypothetical protein [bacterium]